MSNDTNQTIVQGYNARPIVSSIEKATTVKVAKYRNTVFNKLGRVTIASLSFILFF